LSIKKDKKIEEIEKLQNKAEVLENKLPIQKIGIFEKN
jgi:hypothetical protein